MEQVKEEEEEDFEFDLFQTDLTFEVIESTSTNQNSLKAFKKSFIKTTNNNNNNIELALLKEEVEEEEEVEDENKEEYKQFQGNKNNKNNNNNEKKMNTNTLENTNKIRSTYKENKKDNLMEQKINKEQLNKKYTTTNNKQQQIKTTIVHKIHQEKDNNTNNNNNISNNGNNNFNNNNNNGNNKKKDKIRENKESIIIKKERKKERNDKENNELKITKKLEVLKDFKILLQEWKNGIKSCLKVQTNHHATNVNNKKRELLYSSSFSQESIISSSDNSNNKSNSSGGISESNNNDNKSSKSESTVYSDITVKREICLDDDDEITNATALCGVEKIEKEEPVIEAIVVTNNYFEEKSCEGAITIQLEKNVSKVPTTTTITTTISALKKEEEQIQFENKTNGTNDKEVKIEINEKNQKLIVNDENNIFNRPSFIVNNLNLHSLFHCPQTSVENINQNENLNSLNNNNYKSYNNYNISNFTGINNLQPTINTLSEMMIPTTIITETITTTPLKETLNEPIMKINNNEIISNGIITLVDNNIAIMRDIPKGNEDKNITNSNDDNNENHVKAHNEELPLTNIITTINKEENKEMENHTELTTTNEFLTTTTRQHIKRRKRRFIKQSITTTTTTPEEEEESEKTITHKEEQQQIHQLNDENNNNNQIINNKKSLKKEKTQKKQQTNLLLTTCSSLLINNNNNNNNENHENHEEECNICLLELYKSYCFKDNNDLYQLYNCGHKFHLSCVFKCISSRNTQKHCMICYKSIDRDEEKLIKNLYKNKVREERLSNRNLKKKQKNLKEKENCSKNEDVMNEDDGVIVNNNNDCGDVVAGSTMMTKKICEVYNEVCDNGYFINDNCQLFPFHYKLIKIWKENGNIINHLRFEILLNSNKLNSRLNFNLEEDINNFYLFKITLQNGEIITNDNLQELFKQIKEKINIEENNNEFEYFGLNKIINKKDGLNYFNKEKDSILLNMEFNENLNYSLKDILFIQKELEIERLNYLFTNHNFLQTTLLNLEQQKNNKKRKLNSIITINQKELFNEKKKIKTINLKNKLFYNSSNFDVLFIFHNNHSFLENHNYTIRLFNYLKQTILKIDNQFLNNNEIFNSCKEIIYYFLKLNQIHSIHFHNHFTIKLLDYLILKSKNLFILNNVNHLTILMNLQFILESLENDLNQHEDYHHHSLEEEDIPYSPNDILEEEEEEIELVELKEDRMIVNNEEDQMIEEDIITIKDKEEQKVEHDEEVKLQKDDVMEEEEHTFMVNNDDEHYPLNEEKEVLEILSHLSYNNHNNNNNEEEEELSYNNHHKYNNNNNDEKILSTQNSMILEDVIRNVMNDNLSFHCPSNHLSFQHVSTQQSSISLSIQSSHLTFNNEDETIPSYNNTVPIFPQYY
ncbi:hypothetical protein ABK040_015228 [Willaertia magna]